MKLYYSPGACSLSPHIVIREAGLPAEAVKVDLKAKKTEKGEDYARINPKGYVPALELDDGQVLTEGPAIVQYLADKKPDAKLAPPAGSLERTRVQEWLNFISTELHKSFSPLFGADTPDAYKAIAKKRLSDRLALVDRHLAGKDYLMGKSFSIADAYLFTVASWSKYVDLDISGLKNLGAFLARMAARPAVQAALKAEGLA
ncbi:MAG: glutathione transferase GstA [Pseudomonadota bacterium]